MNDDIIEVHIKDKNDKIEYITKLLEIVRDYNIDVVVIRPENFG